MTTIASIIATLQAHPGEKMSGEELFFILTDEEDKQTLYSTLTQYSRAPHKLLLREKPVGENHYRYWLDPDKKLPANIEDMLLRRAAELEHRKQREEDTTVPKRMNGEAKQKMSEPILDHGADQTSMPLPAGEPHNENAGAATPGWQCLACQCWFVGKDAPHECKPPATAGPQSTSTQVTIDGPVDLQELGQVRPHRIFTVPKVTQAEAFKAVIDALEERERYLSAKHQELDQQIEALVGLQGSVALQISDARTARHSLQLILGDTT